jgi:endonuclease/exonuclease/phosphatase family metal-dependent hydrolase
MAGISKKKRRKLLVAVSLLIGLAYMLSLLGWFFDASQFSPGAIFSIGFAYLWPTLLLLFSFWLFIDKKVSVALFVLLLIGLQPALVTFSIGIPKKFSHQKAPSSFRIMQWNCMDFPVNGVWSAKHMEDREKVKSFFSRYQPDVICLQDFNEIEGPLFLSNIQFIRDTLGYPYMHTYFRAFLIMPYGKIKMGMLIASRLPFAASGFQTYEAPEFANPILWADILWQGKPLRIVTTHFQSMNLFSHKTFNPHSLPYYFRPDSAIIMSPKIMMKLRHYQGIHAQQAKRLSAFIDTTRVPVMLAADLNTVPANHVYKTVKGNRLSDGFLGSKTGLGNTFNFLLPNLRIDYLLHDKALKNIQWHHFVNGFFDHDHLVGDFSWP